MTRNVLRDSHHLYWIT